MANNTTFRISSNSLKELIEQFYRTDYSKDSSSDEKDKVNDWLIDQNQHSHTEYHKIRIATIPRSFAQFLLDDHTKIGKRAYEYINAIHGNRTPDDIAALLVTPLHPTVKRMHLFLTELFQSTEYKACVTLGDYDYPLAMECEYGSRQGQVYIYIQGVLTTAEGHTLQPVSGTLSGELLQDLIEQGYNYERLLGHLKLSIQRFRGAQEREYQQLIHKAKVLQFKTAQRIHSGTAIRLPKVNSWDNSIDVSPNCPESPCIVEAYLENANIRNDRYGSIKPIQQSPLVRIFNLRYKSYYYVDIRELSIPKWDPSLLDRLILPKTIKHTLGTLFQTPKSQILSDIVSTQANNLIILASGKPGVGKSLTAEIYSHTVKRFIYPIETHEVGADITTLEANLDTIFNRIAKWGSILLFDECDIFLAQRSTDLQRCVLVGIFLRKIEQFQGLLFLTTNRPEAIDKAMYSRITLHIRYPDLDLATKRSIWELFLQRSGLQVQDIENIDKLAEIPLNGREIRNKARLLKALLNSEEVHTIKSMVKLIQDTI